MPKLVEDIRNPDFVRPIYFTSNPQAEGCAVVFRDSFGAAMKTFLGYHFGKVGYYWTVSGFEPEIVEENRPTVVITEIVERNFNNGDLLKSPQPVVAN